MAKDNKSEKIVGEAPTKSESTERTVSTQTQAKEENRKQQPESTPEQTGEEKQPPSPATAFANTPEEIADRKAAAATARKEEKKENRTARKSGTENRLAAEAKRIFAAYPDASVVYMTSNGFGFFKESEARNHANTLRDTTVTTIKRK